MGDLKLRTKAFVIPAVMACTLLTSVSKVLWKAGADQLPNSLTNWPIFAGLTLYGIVAIAFLYLLKHNEASVVFPVMATSYIWVALLSAHYFAESLTALKWAGIAAIFTGVVIIGTDVHKHQRVVV